MTTELAFKLSSEFEFVFLRISVEFKLNIIFFINFFYK